MEELKFTPSQTDSEQYVRFLTILPQTKHLPNGTRKIQKLKVSDVKDDIKIELLLRKFEPEERTEYTRYFDLKEPTDLLIDENLEQLKSYFEKCTSLFKSRLQCLHCTVKEGPSIAKFVVEVNWFQISNQILNWKSNSNF